MRIISCLAAAAFFLGGAASASAQHWYRVGGDSALAGYVDADSIRGDGDIKRANVYTVYSAPAEGLHAGGILSEFFCAENVFRTIEYRYFGADNVLMGTEPSRSPDQRRTPVPGTLDAMFFRFVCRREGGVAVGADAWSDAQVFFRGSGRSAQ
jgi:hypothetical protein